MTARFPSHRLGTCEGVSKSNQETSPRSHAQQPRGRTHNSPAVARTTAPGPRAARYTPHTTAPGPRAAPHTNAQARAAATARARTRGTPTNSAQCHLRTSTVSPPVPSASAQRCRRPRAIRPPESRSPQGAPTAGRAQSSARRASQLFDRACTARSAHCEAMNCDSYPVPTRPIGGPSTHKRSTRSTVTTDVPPAGMLPHSTSRNRIPARDAGTVADSAMESLSSLRSTRKQPERATQHSLARAVRKESIRRPPLPDGAQRHAHSRRAHEQKIRKIPAARSAALPPPRGPRQRARCVRWHWRRSRGR